MDCDETRPHLHDLVKRRLDPAVHAEVVAHLEDCARCGAAVRAERALDELLEDRLPFHPAPPALRRRLGLLVGRPPAVPARRRWARVVAPALAAGVALVVAGALLARRPSRDDVLAGLTSEVVNDHLRVLASPHPVDVESGGTHQVKPWFEGKLDFAPVVPGTEGTELRLRGGAVGYVFDRKAAVLVYGLRLHEVTLLVFRPEGLAPPGGGDRQLGPVRARERSARGFNVVLWEAGGLGYALVSDVNAAELREAAARFAAETVGRAP